MAITTAESEIGDSVAPGTPCRPDAASRRPVVVVAGDRGRSLPLAEVKRSWDGVGRTGLSDVEIVDPPRDDRSLVGVPSFDGATLVLHSDGAVQGLEWARRCPDGIRAIVLVDPVLRPLSARERSVDGADVGREESIAANARWLAASHVPKLLVTTAGTDQPADDTTADWASLHVRNLTLERIDSTVDGAERLARVLRSWLVHICW